MISGTVLETIEVPGRVWINCRDNTSGDECGIYVKVCVEARCISERDTVRWDAECPQYVCWTPRERVGGRPLLGQEKRLSYIGHSKGKPTSGVKLEEVGVA